MIVSPLIAYLVIVPGDVIYGASFMQGFAQSLLESSHLIERIVRLPADIFEYSDWGRDILVQRRMSGVSPVRWYGQSPRAIRSQPHPADAPFTLIVLPPGESPRDYDEWAQSSPTRPFIVAQSDGDLTYDGLNIESLQQHFLRACDNVSGEVDHTSIERSRSAIEQWRLPAKRQLGYQLGGHNTIAPNIAALGLAGFDNLLYGRFNKQDPTTIAPYVDQIVRTTESILDERARLGENALHRINRLTLDLNIFAPSIYPHFLSLAPASDWSHEQKLQFRTAIATLRNQSGYGFALTEAQSSTLFGREFVESGGKIEPAMNPLILLRAQENFFSTAVMSSVAASEFSAVVRLPNDINRSSGIVRSFAEHYRSDAPKSRKRLESFRRVQARLREAVPSELVALIRQSTTGIRIVSDAHIEWLNVDGLPLVLRNDCTRVPVTPGNLFVSQLAATPLLHLTPESLTDILVLSALKPDDPIKVVFEIAFREFEKQWQKRLNVKFAEVASKADLVKALNDFEGNVIVFDGHGSHEADGAGKLYLQEESIDIWGLQNENVRVPAIVILSACDTHAADRNHATTANGFMLLGARTVLSSVFPLHAQPAAMFVVRLLYRIADYIPVAIEMRQKALTWLEVVSGMIRMQLLTDFLRQLLRKKQITEREYRDVHMVGNLAINSFEPAPFEIVLSKLTELGKSEDQLRYELELAISQSSAISYLQIGRPETIMIDDAKRIDEQFRRMAEVIASDG